MHGKNVSSKGPPLKISCPMFQKSGTDVEHSDILLKYKNYLAKPEELFLVSLFAYS